MTTKARNQLKAFTARVRKAIQRTLGEDELRMIGEEAIRLIVQRTLQGFGVAEDGGSRERLKPLSPEYVEFRRRYSSELSGETSPTKSNLTLSGQMLESMQVLQVGNGRVTVGPKGSRSGPFASDLSNDELARIVQRVRPFNHLSKQEQDQLLQLVRKRLLERLS